MGAISLTSKGGGLDRMRRKVQNLKEQKMFDKLDSYGKEGAAALAAATPVESGETATSWTYDIIREGGVVGIRWRNTHMVGSAPLAILLQYGHGTGTGGYVAGRDYINPVIKPLFDRIKADVRKAVSSA